MNPYDFTREQLAEFIAPYGGRPTHAASLWRYLYREVGNDLQQIVELPARLRTRLAADLSLAPLEIAGETHGDAALTRKYLLALADGRQIETVLMQSPGRATACLSSQVGCALGCVFCATGQIGFTRNLTAGEIVAQAVHVERVLRGIAAIPPAGNPPRRRRHGLRNVVLMGMGEPLVNYDAVMTAIEILRDPGGFAIGAKQITLSTVGVIPGIVRLADERRPCSLAVSLHAANQADRAALVPAAHAWPLDELLAACRYYTTRLGRRIFFEWTLIEGKNDSTQQAQALARLVQGRPAQINLIPLNSTAGYPAGRGRWEAVERFRATLRECGLPVSIRRRRGIDIAAGCGQLAGARSAAIAAAGA
jgi:23S rRNA (adenine2503-C2)-methyltransferase